MSHSMACVCCVACRKRHARYQMRRRQDALQGLPRKVPSFGTQRRLQALIAAGWSWRQISERYGCTGGALQRHLTGETCLSAVAEAVAELYDQLAYVTPPRHHMQDWQSQMAAERGWAAPWEWPGQTIDQMDAIPAAAASLPAYDTVAVERILSGDWHLRVAAAERCEVVRRWLAAGEALNRLERLTGWNARRVIRVARVAA